MANYVLNEEKMFSDIADGVAIVINSETGVYYGMNGFGTEVFEKIIEGASTDDIINAMKSLNGAPEDCESRLENFVKELLAFEIIVEDSPNSTNVALNQNTADDDKFILQVQEFNDAQELLLADPIHEVKNETGWQPTKDALETDEDAVKEKYKKTEK